MHPVAVLAARIEVFVQTGRGFSKDFVFASWKVPYWFSPKQPGHSGTESYRHGWCLRQWQIPGSATPGLSGRQPGTYASTGYAYRMLWVSRPATLSGLSAAGNGL